MKYLKADCDGVIQLCEYAKNTEYPLNRITAYDYISIKVIKNREERIYTIVYASILKS